MSADHRRAAELGHIFHGNLNARLSNAEADVLIAAYDEAVKALREVRRFRRGEGRYNLRRFPAEDRGIVYYDLWEEVEAQINAILSQIPEK